MTQNTIKETTILWADDEIDLLKPHLIFLQNKGYRMLTATNGIDAIKLVHSNTIDLIFLDENMPGKSGLQVLDEIKHIHPNIPVVMITKSEEENIMDQAIGSKIADYLIKPVNPNQILLTIKKNTENKKLISQKTTSDYQTEFSKLGLLINTARNMTDWIEIYKNLVYWDIEISKSSEGMDEVLKLQRNEANSEFSKFIKSNYSSWFKPDVKEKPLMSPAVIKHAVLPLLEKGEKVIFILIDNLRFDQWQTISPTISEFCNIDSEELYCSILPTATQYARNAMFAGLMPLEIEKMYPNLWIGEDEDEEGSKNQFEEELLKTQMTRIGKGKSFAYEKILNEKTAGKIVSNFSNYKNNDLTVIVYNFVDSLSHARTESDMIRDLANDETALRSIILSWFQHSQLIEIIKESARNNFKIVITTDHGTMRVFNPIKIIGDRHTSTNLRYKMGRNLNYNPKEVFEIRHPADIHLPGTNLSSSFVFATNADFLVYPNNYNHYVNYYRNTFHHGGVSLEEMIIPLITLSAK